MRQPEFDPHDQRVVRAIELLHAWLGRDHRLYEVASALGVSEGFLQGIFKARLGVDLTAYRTFIRLDRARRLLGCPALAIGEVARLSGFRRHAYFTKVFREASSMTPTEYRAGVLAQVEPGTCPARTAGTCPLVTLGLGDRLRLAEQDGGCAAAEAPTIRAGAPVAVGGARAGAGAPS